MVCLLVLTLHPICCTEAYGVNVFAGLLVHHRIKHAMDQGLLVIVPMLRAAGRWLCILVDKTKADIPALGTKMYSHNVIKFGVSIVQGISFPALSNNIAGS